MLVSLVTPLSKSGNGFIAETYRSILAALGPDQPWEWVILENNDGYTPRSIRDDSHVRTFSAVDAKGIGALKKAACEFAKGDVLVELDHDDELAPGALERIAEAFAHHGADFVYSDFAEFTDAGGGKRAHAPDYPYSGQFGWTHYATQVAGQEYIAMRAAAVTAHNLRLIDWCPNHVRAWSRAAYDEVGGHNPALPVGDDHELCIRFYLAGKRFVHIPECLYLYRVHAANTVKLQNPAIRDRAWQNYEKFIWPLAEKWTKEQGLGRVDLCGGLDSPSEYEVLDRSCPPFPDLNAPWPLRDKSVGILRAFDAVEHLVDPVHTMNEAYRVLAPGGFMMIHVPSTNGLGAFCDPTHKSFWNRLSFRYYTDRAYARYVSEFVGRFQQLRLLEWFPSEWHKAENVPYVDAELVALKPGFHPMGAVSI